MTTITIPAIAVTEAAEALREAAWTRAGQAALAIAENEVDSMWPAPPVDHDAPAVIDALMAAWETLTGREPRPGEADRMIAERLTTIREAAKQMEAAERAINELLGDESRADERAELRLAHTLAMTRYYRAAGIPLTRP